MLGVEVRMSQQLSESQTRELIRLCKTGNLEARRQLIEANLGLVRAVVSRFRGPDLEDLFQVGCLGLIKAVDRFDPGRGTKFSTYAFPLILGEVRKYLRDNWQEGAPRRLKQIWCKARQVEQRLTNQLGRPASFREVAEEMGIPPEELVASMEACAQALALEEEVLHTSRLPEQQGAIEERVALWECLNALEERERRLLLWRFFVGKTQSEIADSIGLSQAQVSRMEWQALRKLRQGLSC
ncbi:MAG: sigma-70 family RNA polymerase sigma factor [Bacillota bacterium]